MTTTTRIAGPADNARVLAQCLLFKPLAEEDREVLARRAYRQDFKAGDRLFRFGDPGESMMIVLQGHIRILRPMASDKELILGDLEAGDILGEMALLDGKPRSAEARAITNGKALVLARRDLLPFLEAHPQVALTLLGVLCEMIRRADERTSDFFSSLATRLAKTLVRLSDKTSKLSLSQSELADMTGSTRESVNRQLSAWQSEGLVELRDGWILITERQALMARSRPAG
ncbi:MAG: Crp/Fnr family transcriptional regulator [Bauldia sp.]|nr:Crp/Fnr family transcriptional regulator [Bauldia sp.]